MYFVLFFVCTCSVQLIMFHMERHSGNTIIINIIIIIIIIIIITIIIIIIIIISKDSLGHHNVHTSDQPHA